MSEKISNKSLGLKITEEELSQTIPKKWLGGSISNDLALEIAFELREYMTNRVSKGRGLGNEVFSPNVYSKSYQESEVFKAYGKTPKPVNMRLTGDMLRSIDIGVSEKGTPVVSITGEDAPKAHGHQTGQYGKGPLPKRPFFGVTKDEFEKVARKFKDRIEAEFRQQELEKSRSYNEAVAKLPHPKHALDILKEFQTLKKIIKLIK